MVTPCTLGFSAWLLGSQCHYHTYSSGQQSLALPHPGSSWWRNEHCHLMKEQRDDTGEQSNEKYCHDHLWKRQPSRIIHIQTGLLSF